MGQAAWAYDYDAYESSAYPAYASNTASAPYARPAQVPSVQTHRPRLKVVAGKAASAHVSLAQSAPQLMAVARFTLVVAVLVCAIGLIRIACYSQTINTLMKNDELSAQIVQAQKNADDLEVQYSVYANPARVRHIAMGTLGMVAPTSVAELDVSSSAVVAQNKGGVPEKLAIETQGASATSADKSSAPQRNVGRTEAQPTVLADASGAPAGHRLVTAH